MRMCSKRSAVFGSEAVVIVVSRRLEIRSVPAASAPNEGLGWTPGTQQHTRSSIVCRQWWSQ